MMYHNTKFGNKIFGGLGDIIWTNINILTLRCDLDPECSNPFFFTGYSGLWWCIIRPNLVAKESPVQKIQPYFYHTSPFCDLGLKESNNNKKNISAWQTGSRCCIIIPNLVTKCSVAQKISSRQTFIIIVTFAVTLTLNAVIPFFYRRLRLMMLYYHTRFGCKRTSTLENIVNIIIFWLYKPPLWPWHGR